MNYQHPARNTVNGECWTPIADSDGNVFGASFQDSREGGMEMELPSDPTAQPAQGDTQCTSFLCRNVCLGDAYLPNKERSNFRLSTLVVKLFRSFRTMHKRD